MTSLSRLAGGLVVAVSSFSHLGRETALSVYSTQSPALPKNAAHEQGAMDSKSSSEWPRHSDFDVSGTVSEETAWRALSTVLDSCSPTTSDLWDDTTCRTLHQGAYLGNGDLGVHLGGTKHKLVWYLGKNAFHAGNNPAGAEGDGKWTQHILNLAVLTIEKVGGVESGEDYEVTQDLKHSEVRTRCTMAGAPVQTTALLSPSRNVFVVELSTTGGRSVPLSIDLSVMGNEHVVLRAGAEQGVAWVIKEPNAKGAPFYVKGAVAVRVLGAEVEATTDGGKSSRLAFTLPSSGDVVTLFVQAEHRKNADSPLAEVHAAAKEITEAAIAAIAIENRDWWKDFWLRGYIKVDDDIQKYWYNHLYLIGSAARSGADNGPGRLLAIGDPGTDATT